MIASVPSDMCNFIITSYMGLKYRRGDLHITISSFKSFRIKTRTGLDTGMRRHEIIIDVEEQTDTVWMEINPTNRISILIILYKI